VSGGAWERESVNACERGRVGAGARGCVGAWARGSVNTWAGWRLSARKRENVGALTSVCVGV